MSPDRPELKIIPVDQWVDKDRRPPKGVRIHNRLAKAAYPDTPFHRVLILQEQLRARQIQDERARQEVAERLALATAQAAETARLKRERDLAQQRKEERRVLEERINLLDKEIRFYRVGASSITTIEQYVDARLTVLCLQAKVFSVSKEEFVRFLGNLSIDLRYSRDPAGYSYLTTPVKTADGKSRDLISIIKEKEFTPEEMARY